MSQLPSIVRKYWYSIDWDVESLWQLDLPTESFPIDLLAWQFEVPVWEGPAGPYTLTPAAVMAAPEDRGHRQEFARIERADLSFPIEIYFNVDRWMVLDGIHRLAKASLAGSTHINVRKVPDWAVTSI